MGRLLNDNTVNEKLTNAAADLAVAAEELNEVLTALAAIMPCLPGSQPLTAENGKIENAAESVSAANLRISEIREMIPSEVMRNRRVITGEGTNSES